MTTCIFQTSEAFYIKRCASLFVSNVQWFLKKRIQQIYYIMARQTRAATRRKTAEDILEIVRGEISEVSEDVKQLEHALEILHNFENESDPPTEEPQVDPTLVESMEETIEDTMEESMEETMEEPQVKWHRITHKILSADITYFQRV